jgi:hypothetical protein
MFECLVFLKANREFWGQFEVAQALKKQRSNEMETKDFEELREIMEKVDSLEI